MTTNLNLSEENRALIEREYPHIQGAEFQIKGARFYPENLERLLNAARDQGRTLSLGGGWRPIESAPRDGTRVHLGFAHMTGFDVIGHSFGDAWMSNGSPDERPCTYCGADNLFHGRPEPTHWRPLPAPPSNPQRVGE